VDSEARAHRVTGQKQSGGLFLGRGLRLCSQLEESERASCAQLAYFTAPSPTKQKDIRLDVLFALLGGEKKVDSEARAHAVVWR